MTKIFSQHSYIIYLVLTFYFFLLFTNDHRQQKGDIIYYPKVGTLYVINSFPKELNLHSEYSPHIWQGRINNCTQAREQINEGYLMKFFSF